MNGFLNIGFYLLKLDPGGHVLTALCYAKYLQELEINIIFYSEGGSFISEIERYDFKYRLLKPVKRHPHPMRILELHRYCNDDKIKIIQTFDTQGAMEAACLQALGSALSANTFISTNIPSYQLGKIGIPITIRQSFQQYLIEKCGWSKEKIIFLPGRIDYHLLRKNCLMPPGLMNIVWLGRLDEFKGGAVRYLFAAWPRVKETCPTARLFIAGDGPIREELLNRAKKENLKVEFLGLVEPYKALNYADIVVGIERVAIEALSVGRPVILLDSYGRAELAIKERLLDLMLNNFNPINQIDSVKLAELLIELIQDQNLQQTMGQSGKEWCDRFLDPRDSAKHLAKAYHEALNSNTYRFADIIELIKYAISYGKFITGRRIEYFLRKIP